MAALLGGGLYTFPNNAAGRMIIAAMLYHGLGNLVREMVPDVSNLAKVGVEAALSLAVILVAWRWIVKSIPGD